jgi:hypothetical protein
MAGSRITILLTFPNFSDKTPELIAPRECPIIVVWFLSKPHSSRFCFNFSETFGTEFDNSV